MYVIKGDNINEIQLTLFNHLKSDGKELVVRNQKTVEIYPVIIHLTNINNRCTSFLKRKWNIVFALGEFAWHLNGSDDLNFINYYSHNWNSVSEDKSHICESCYGAKIFRFSHNWNNLIEELTAFPNSRRAVINLYDSEKTLGKNKLDVACTLSLQFLLRNNKLDLIVTMRSNDIIWGLPNDIFFFTMLQEYLSLQLNVDKGEYYHQIGSLHIYERHFSLLHKIIENPAVIEFTMPDMRDDNFVYEFLKCEAHIRLIGSDDVNTSSEYWNNLLNIVKLRSSNISEIEKNKIIDQSPYRDIIRLSPFITS